jgi:phage terminase large subunit
MFIEAAREAHCPASQIRLFLKAGAILQPKQLAAAAAARTCDRPNGPTEIGYGGARSGGKTHWLLVQIAIDDCQRYPGLKCLLLRKVGKANKESFQDLRRRILRQLRHTYHRQEGVLSFPNGSQIVLGHFQNEADIDAYLGLEYDVIGVEEATTLSHAKYRAIQTCCRTSKPDWRPRIYSTTNPGGVGHAWYKARFVDPPTGPRDTVFIPATVDDNRYINADYRLVLDRLTGWLKKAWRYGDWDIAAGQFFINWRRDLHVRNYIDAQPGWRYWCALDYGFTHYTCVHLLARDGDGTIYILDEHAERGMLPERHAPAIKAMLARNRLDLSRLYQFVAGADVFAKVFNGGTVADAYRAQGIRLERANDDRIAGAGKILSLLGDAEATSKDEQGNLVPAPIVPSLFIHARCGRLIETLPALQHDPHRPEDVLKTDCDSEGEGGDDAYDSARYGIMASFTLPAHTAYGAIWAKATPKMPASGLYPCF